MAADSVTLGKLSSFDDWDYRQALVLHETFDDSRVSPRMEAVLERMRTTKVGDHIAMRRDRKTCWWFLRRCLNRAGSCRFLLVLGSPRRNLDDLVRD